MRRASYLPLLLALTAGAARADNFDFASLESLIASGDIGTIEELLAALPEAQRSRYALLFESRSLQEASPENPRVVLYGPDARLILTFNGNPSQRGFRVVETLEFDGVSREFRLRELEFPEHPRGAAGVLVSEVNPPRCMRCHGEPPRPLWDTFPLWPGAYGERYGASLSPREHAGLARFLALQPMHPRYRYLPGASRFADPQTFRPSARSQYSSLTPEPPNAELSSDLGDLQLLALAARLVRQSAFATYRYALLGVADNGCSPLADFYPESLWHSQRQAFERFARDTARANARQAQLKAARATAGGRAAAPAAANTLLPLRFVAESALRIPTEDWTLALETATFDFTRPPSPSRPLREALLAAIAPGDRTLETLSYSETSADGDRYCSYLKRRSVAALAGPGSGAPEALAQPPAGGSDGARAPATTGSGATAPPAALRLCVNCHETGAAPLIPFSRPAMLARELRERPAPHGTLLEEIRYRLSAGAGAHRMPLGVNLADAEQQELDAYFATLANSVN
ncbi:MAG TPA: hypothetical protein VEU54_08375 [Steroidobacteraceae bacterium]|nr:hypothetical protein [Steroidobacteraceae bacterium]